MAADIPAHSLAQLQEQFSRLSTDYLAAVGGASPSSSSPRLAASMQAYLTRVRDTCRATWARFSPAKMAVGLLVLGLACWRCWSVSEASAALTRGEGPALRRPAAEALIAAGCAAATQLVARGYMETAWCLVAAALTGELALLWRTYRSRSIVTTTKSSAKAKTGSWLRPQRLLAPPSVVLLLRCCSLLSDSYVVAEGRAVTFLLSSLVLSLPLRLNWEGLLLPAAPDPLKAAGLLPSPPLSPSAARRESGSLLGCAGLLIGCLFASLSFHACREEQGACQPSPFLSPLSRLQSSQQRNLHYVLAVCCLGLWTYLLRRCLRHYGNLNASGGAAFVARWLLPLLSACLALHWAVSATPEDSFRTLWELMVLAQRVLPRTAYALLGLALLLIWVRPLTVFVKTKMAASGPAPPPPRYRASTAISPQAELHHLIPQIYQRMRRSLEDGEPGGGGEAGSRPAVEAYGLGTVYSAPLLLLWAVLGLGLLLLHPEGMALSFLLLLLETGALLHLHASSVSLSGQTGKFCTSSSSSSCLMNPSPQQVSSTSPGLPLSPGLWPLPSSSTPRVTCPPSPPSSGAPPLWASRTDMWAPPFPPHWSPSTPSPHTSCLEVRRL